MVIVPNVAKWVVDAVSDAVSDVIPLLQAQLRPMPGFRSAIASDCLLAIGSINDRVLIHVDIKIS
jgi:purine-binding chemotaxis protein CheW